MPRFHGKANLLSRTGENKASGIRRRRCKWWAEPRNAVGDGCVPRTYQTERRAQRKAKWSINFDRTRVRGSPGGGLAAFAGVGGGGEAVAGRVSRHGLGTAELVDDFDVVAFLFKADDDGVVQALLDFQDVGAPLVMELCRVDGGLKVAVKVEDADDVEEGLVDDGWAAGGAEGEDGVATLEDEGRSHAGEGTLAGSDGVGFGGDEAEVVGDAGLGGEVVHFVVQNDAGSGNDDFGAEI